MSNCCLHVYKIFKSERNGNTEVHCNHDSIPDMCTITCDTEVWISHTHKMYKIELHESYMDVKNCFIILPINSTSDKRKNTSLTSDLVAIYGLGAAVGLLVLLLVATITGWIWTCCVMKRREKILITGR